MRGWLTSLIEWCGIPVCGGFAELDKQISKLRLLKDSYQTPLQMQRHHRMADTKKDGKSVCIP